MLGEGETVDLYRLFMVVKEKGGYDAVCKNRLWDLVGEEYGLGVKVGSSVELVYSKHLGALDTWLKNDAADSKFPECGLVDDRVKFCQRLIEAQPEFSLGDYGEEEEGDEVKSRVYDYLDGKKLYGTYKVKGKNSDSNGTEVDRVCNYLDGRKLCGTNRVKGMNPESNGAKKVQNGGHDLNMCDHGMKEPVLGNLCDHNAAIEILEEFDEGQVLAVDVSNSVTNMPRLSDGGSDNDDDDNDDDNDDDDEVVMLDPPSVNKESCDRKRKRESTSEMLSWVTGIAKNPCDPTVGSIPEKSKWKSYSNQEIWKQVLLFREAVFLKKDFGSSTEKLNWQGQKMHPCMYDDQTGAAYNLRERSKCDKRLLSGTSKSDGDLSAGTQGVDRNQSPSTEDCAKKQFLDSGTAFSSLDESSTVHIPVGPTHQAEVPEWTGAPYESDSKWLGTKIWPSETVNSKLLIERDPIGKGRQDSCGCQVRGSVECVQFHITEKRAKVKMELGVAFYQWNLHKAGEEVRFLWTEQEEKKFQDVVKSNPASLDSCFWDHLFKTFPMKSREDLVNYYFNVFILQRRGHQNRHTLDNIDSDDDESEFGPLKNVFGHQTQKPRRFTKSSQKPQTKGR